MAMQLPQSMTDTAAILGTGTADRYRLEREHTLTI